MLLPTPISNRNDALFPYTTLFLAHVTAVLGAAAAGKAVLWTKPCGRNAAEAKRMLEAGEKAGVFHGYLEDLVYTPKTIKALESVQKGALGTILWARSREAHPGPHSNWFWDRNRQAVAPSWIWVSIELRSAVVL